MNFQKPKRVQIILTLIFINSAVTSIEYKFSLGEICDASFYEAMLCDGAQLELLEVVNATEHKLFLDIHKFLPERCIPDFILSWNDSSITNSNLWSPVIFWISDGYSSQRDIFRYSNMRVSDPISFFCEDVINNMFDINQTMTREQSITPSIKTLSEFIDDGITWWAPIPDNRLKSRDGRDLNLEVICSMMVRLRPFTITYKYRYYRVTYLFSLCCGHFFF
jgi:hypothetical protein